MATISFKIPYRTRPSPMCSTARRCPGAQLLAVAAGLGGHRPRLGCHRPPPRLPLPPRQRCRVAERASAAWQPSTFGLKGGVFLIAGLPRQRPALGTSTNPPPPSLLAAVTGGGGGRFGGNCVLALLAPAQRAPVKPPAYPPGGDAA